MQNFDGPCRVWHVGRKGCSERSQRGEMSGITTFFILMPNLPIAGQGCTSTPSKSRERSVSLLFVRVSFRFAHHGAWWMCVCVAGRVSADTDGSWGRPEVLFGCGDRADYEGSQGAVVWTAEDIFDRSAKGAFRTRGEHDQAEDTGVSGARVFEERRGGYE